MEVVIGVILLIGSFALGQTTADQEAAETRARLEREQAVESLENGCVPQDCRYRVNGPVQRDLTVPYSRQRSSDGAGSILTRVGVGDE
ncbi:MAG: hypothetical protein GY788_06350 [bacterium]|nr:hypothetical protein [bacterium]